MAQQPMSGVPSHNWWEASGLRQIFRTPTLAIHPTKLGIALAAIFATWAWGLILDAIWVRGGGIDPDAVTKFAVARDAGLPYVEGGGIFGPYAIWRAHETVCIDGFLRSVIDRVIPGNPTVVIEPVAGTSLVPVCRFGSGCWWLLRMHPFFFLLFMGGALLIWSLGGGAICRVAAVQIARDEKLTISQGLAYGFKKWFGGFLLAPCVPLGFAIITVILLILGGLLLRVPFVGDIICGLLFPLAIIGGFVAALLLVGLFFGGSLFWPAVAAEGSDGFDAFSRGLSYFVGRFWKSIFYGVALIILGSFCWIVANAFAGFALAITHGAVGYGTSVKHWEPLGNKLNGLWPRVVGVGYVWPAGPLSWYEWFCAACIAVCVILVIALVWAFLASFYFSGSTVAYFLLRKDVDGTEMNEVISDDSGGVASAAPPTEPGASSSAPESHQLD